MTSDEKNPNPTEANEREEDQAVKDYAYDIDALADEPTTQKSPPHPKRWGAQLGYSSRHGD